MENDELPPIVARCQRCGRGFVWVNPQCPRDQYPPMGGTRRSCGGIIGVLPEPEPNNDFAPYSRRLT
jgi:hypothetical protein